MSPSPDSSKERDGGLGTGSLRLECPNEEVATVSEVPSSGLGLYHGRDAPGGPLLRRNVDLVEGQISYTTRRSGSVPCYSTPCLGGGREGTRRPEPTRISLRLT